VPSFPRAVERRQEAGLARHQVELDTRALLSEANHVPVNAGPEGPAGEAEVDRLEQIRLAGTVRPVNDHDRGCQGGAGIGEVAKPAALDCAHDRH
jgi:hypothetical protein